MRQGVRNPYPAWLGECREAIEVSGGNQSDEIIGFTGMELILQ